jgi:hypothetical protein
MTRLYKEGDQVIYVEPTSFEMDLTLNKIYTITQNQTDADDYAYFDDDVGDPRCRDSTDVRLHKTAEQVAAEAKPAERKPWDVLREAADIITAEHLLSTAGNLRITANRLEEEASVPDPIEVLRRYDAAMIDTWRCVDDLYEPAKSIWRDARRVLAAHDKQKKEV